MISFEVAHPPGPTWDGSCWRCTSCFSFWVECTPQWSSRYMSQNSPLARDGHAAWPVHKNGFPCVPFRPLKLNRVNYFS